MRGSLKERALAARHDQVEAERRAAEAKERQRQHEFLVKQGQIEREVRERIGDETFITGADIENFAPFYAYSDGMSYNVDFDALGLRWQIQKVWDGLRSSYRWSLLVHGRSVTGNTTMYHIPHLAELGRLIEKKLVDGG